MFLGTSAAGELLGLAAGGGGAGSSGDGGAGDTSADWTQSGVGGGSSPNGAPGTGGDAADGTGTGDSNGGNGAGAAGGVGGTPNGGGGGGGVHGGGGGGSDSTDGAGGAGGESDGSRSSEWYTASAPGDGSVDVQWETCRVPDAPDVTLTAAGNTTADIEFWPAGFDEYDPASTTTGWEYSVNGGTPAPLTITSGSGDNLHSARITGLTNGVSQQIRVHATSASGDGADSAPVSVTPYKPLGAPANVRFTTTSDSVTFTWDASSAGTYAVSGYIAALGVSYGQSGDTVFTCETGPAVRECTAPAQPGLDYSVHVSAVDSEGNPSAWGDGVPVGKITPSATVPASDGTLQAPASIAGGVAPGEKVTITGSGYAPYSIVTVLVYSEPRVLTTAVTDGTGSFSVEITVPADLGIGQHTLVAAGIDPTGALRYMTLPVTVSEDGAALALTGVDIALPLIGGVAALAVGGGLLLVSRRREVAQA